MSFAALLKPASGPQEIPTTEAFAELRAHVARLDLPDGENVDWSYVQRVATTLLTGESKDLLVATYAAFAPLALGTSSSPHEAIDFLQQYIELFWDMMTPPVARSRARANSLAWFTTRLRVTLPALLPSLSDADRRQCHKAWQAFSNNLTQRLGALAPSTSAVFRLLEDPSPAAHPNSPVDAAPHASAEATPITVQTSAPQQETQDCRTLARSLCLLATQRRQQDAMDLQACRLWRVGLWLNVHGAPAHLGEVTRVVGIPADARARLAQAQRGGQWPTLYTLAEDAMLAHPLCLDLQYYAADALTHMGGTHLALAALVRSETQALCRRIPELLELRAADGAALAMPETQAWLQLHTQNVANVANVAVPLPEASASSRASSRAQRRFREHVKHGQRCLAQGHVDAAEAAYDALMHEVRRHRLGRWEPQLARLVAQGHFDALMRQVPVDIARVRRAYRLWTALDATAAQQQAARMAALSRAASC